MSFGADSESTYIALDSTEGVERLLRLFRYAQVGRCVNSVTHDLNNYLGAIMAYAELVAMEPGLSDESQRMLNEIVGGVKRCSDLVNELTGVARPERPTINLVNMALLTERVMTLRRYDFQVNRIELDLEIQDTAVDLVIDEPKIECAIIYLLSNALERAVETGEKQVRFRLTGSDDAVEIAVINSGEPIASELRETIFEPFFTTKSGDHLGMGLPLARQIVAAHDGDLSYDPARGFVIRLPRQSRMAEAMSADDDASHQ